MSNWFPAPDSLCLSANEVHLWRVFLRKPPLPLDYLASLLAPDEQTRAERLYFAKDQAAFRVGRGYLRVVLARYLALHPSKIVFAYGTTGKPALVGSASTSGICFNVSHAKDIAVYAIAAMQREVGVDVEYVRHVNKRMQIAQRYFFASEYAALSGLPPQEQDVAFLHGWTRKEAFVKACGTGIALDLASVEVTLLPGEPAALLHVAGKDHHQWSIVAFAPTNGYVGALVAAGQGWLVRYWDG
jgi:4'-phosphopantetheinyl transferase